MKGRWILIASLILGTGAVLIQSHFPPPLRRVAIAPKHFPPQRAIGNSSARHLVVDYPDGSVALDWSRDGRFVRVDPLDKRRPLQWRNASYLEVGTHRHVEIEPHKAQRLFARSSFYFGFDANLNRTPLSICRTSTGACRPLRDQPQGLHRQVIDFDNQRFFRSSLNEIMAVNEGDVLHWSTRAGALTSRVRFLKKGFFTENSVVLSPDGRSLIAEISSMDVNSGKNSTSLFDARTGQLRFELSDEDQVADFGFSPSGRQCYIVLPDTDWKSATIVFKNTHNGQTLWQAPTSPNNRPAFSQKKNLVALRGTTGLELHDVSTGTLKQNIPGPTDMLRLAFSPDGSTLWSSHEVKDGGSGQIWSWRLR